MGVTLRLLFAARFRLRSDSNGSFPWRRKPSLAPQDAYLGYLEKIYSASRESLPSVLTGNGNVTVTSVTVAMALALAVSDSIRVSTCPSYPDGCSL